MTRIEDDDDWKTEYEQLSEDMRHFTNVGWQATVAVIVGDALILTPAIGAKTLWISFSLLYVAGTLTILLAWTSIKWAVRSKRIRERLKELGGRHGFDKFSKPEEFLLDFPVANLAIGLMLVVGFGLILLGFLLMIGVPVAPFPH